MTEIGIEVLFPKDDRDAWGRASRAINKAIGALPKNDQLTVLSELDLINKFEAYKECPENDVLFAEYILSLDFAFVKHTKATPITYRHT